MPVSCKETSGAIVQRDEEGGKLQIRPRLREEEEEWACVFWMKEKGGWKIC